MKTIATKFNSCHVELVQLCLFLPIIAVIHSCTEQLPNVDGWPISPTSVKKKYHYVAWILIQVSQQFNYTIPVFIF